MTPMRGAVLLGLALALVAGCEEVRHDCDVGQGFQSTENDPERLLSAIVTGCAAGFGTTVTPNRKSFQIFVNWKIPTTTNDGMDSGSIT